MISSPSLSRPLELRDHGCFSDVHLIIVHRGWTPSSHRILNPRVRMRGGASSHQPARRGLSDSCLKEKRKTAFLIAQDEVATHPDEHELIQQLMDFKLIHIIEPDTSAASGRSGRYEAYTLDFAEFMEPRLRGIEHVEFWKVDEQRRRQGLRESPVYPLDRALVLSWLRLLPWMLTLSWMRSKRAWVSNSMGLLQLPMSSVSQRDHHDTDVDSGPRRQQPAQDATMYSCAWMTRRSDNGWRPTGTAMCGFARSNSSNGRGMRRDYAQP